MSRTDLTDKIELKKSSYTVKTETFRFYIGGRYDQVSVVPNSVDQYASTAVKIVTSRRGTVTKGFNAPVPFRPTFLPENTYSWSQTEYGPKTQFLVQFAKQLPGGVGTRNTTSGVIGYHDAGGPGSIRPEELSSALKEVNNSILQKVKNQKVNLVQAMAERKQTADLIVSTLASLGKAYSKARKGDLVGAAKALGVSPPKGSNVREAFRKSHRKQSAARHVSDRWLELQYGWKPLLSDIFGAAEAYHAARAWKPVRERVKKKVTRHADETFVTVSSDWTTYTNRQVETEITIVAYFSLDNTANKTLSELGITNPLTIAWELTPWSFVVDWFVPIGNFINTLDATLGCTFGGGYIGTWTKGTCRITRVAGTSSSYVMRFGYEVSEMLVRTYTRGGLATFPKPSFPDFKDPFNRTHFANAAALFTTNMRR